MVKRDGPISVIATDKCGDHGALIEEAVGDINQAFGYGKLALRWRDDIRTPEDDEIVFLLGSVSDGRLLIERAGVSSPGSFGPGSFRYWYESYTNQSLTKGLVAIDDSLPIEEIRFLARKYLLSVLGFRGTSRDLRKHESFFSSDYIAKRCQGGEGLPNPRMLTEADSAMLRFSDRWVAASMNWDEIRNVFDRKWSQTQEGFLTPVLDEHTAHEPDKTQLSFKDVQHHSQQAEPLGGSAQRTELEAVLACDLVVLMGKEKDKMASFRLRKGTRGRIVEEQARRSLLFFGSDRLIYVPNEAIDSRGGGAF